MSVTPEVNEIVTLPVHEATVGPTPEPTPPPVAEVSVKREWPRWTASVAVGVVGLVAAGTLGYIQMGTAQQRDATNRQLATTEATLTAAQADASRKKVTADYVALYIAQSGKVQTDYQNWVACNTFSTCRTSSQDLLNDLQAFQSARKSATVPSQLIGADADLGDALSAAIAATQQLISALDNDDTAKFKDGDRKLNAAMLNVAKAQVTLGSNLK